MEDGGLPGGILRTQAPHFVGREGKCRQRPPIPRAPGQLDVHPDRHLRQCQCQPAVAVAQRSMQRQQRPAREHRRTPTGMGVDFQTAGIPSQPLRRQLAQLPVPGQEGIATRGCGHRVQPLALAGCQPRQPRRTCLRGHRIHRHQLEPGGRRHPRVATLVIPPPTPAAISPARPARPAPARHPPRPAPPGHRPPACRTTARRPAGA